MLRRFILWTAILFVTVGGVLTGHHSAAQHDTPIALIVGYKSEYDSSLFYNRITVSLIDPFTDKMWPITGKEVRQYLADGRMPYNPQDDLYDWIMTNGYSPLIADEYVKVVTDAYLGQGGYSGPSVRPSPNWEWIVELDSQGHLSAANLEKGVKRDLFTPHGLTFSDWWYFAVAFSSDNEWVYVNATDANGQSGVYRLRLDGNNPSPVTPIYKGGAIPLAWLEGLDYLLVTNMFTETSSSNTGFFDIGIMNEDGTAAGTIFQPFNTVQIFFEGWIRETKTLLVSKTAPRTSDPEIESIESIQWTPYVEAQWGIMHWQILGLTLDQKWLIMARDNQIARARTDGSLFEVVAKFPEGRYLGSLSSYPDTAYSHDGKFLVAYTWDDTASMQWLYLVNMETHEITEIDSRLRSPGCCSIYPNGWSPDGEYFLYWKPTYMEDTQSTLINAQGNVIADDALKGFRFLGWVTLDELP
ncbi:MAG: hypothetical protein K8L91_01265 [Anaerolineae bacterium]|nr:hypothetical protein [Anaerolineae bacterium]